MRTAQVGGAHDGPQIVRVLDAVAQHQKGLLAPGLGGAEQIVQRGVLDLGGAGGHPLVIRRAAHFLQLIARHPLDHRAALLGQGCVVARHGLGHRVRQVDRIHRAAALEQLCHGILAPHKGIGALGALRRLLAGESFHSILHLACKIGHKPTVPDYAL